MLLRRAFFHWLILAAIVLPLWLLIGWGVFDAGGWAFLWVLFIALPSVFLGQLFLALLIRARPTVRAERAVSWWDVLGLTVWHGLTIAVGFYGERVFFALLILAVLAGVANYWLAFRQLWSEARSAGPQIVQTSAGPAFLPPRQAAPGSAGFDPFGRRAPAGEEEVIVISESPRGDERP